MPSQRNKDLLQVAQEKVDRASAMFFVDYQGLTHKQLEEARSALRENDSEMTVVKNSLMNLALKNKKVDVSQRLHGAHATLFSYSDPVKTAKALYAFFKKYLPAGRQVSQVIKFGVFEGRIIDEATINQLATLPSREVLLGKLVGLLKSPMTNLVYDLNWNIRKLVFVLKSVEDKKRLS